MLGGAMLLGFVMKALAPEQTSGESYMAKIVQISFELPIPDHTSLRKMLELQLKKILKDKLLDKEEWDLAYGEFTTDTSGNGISCFIKTPRDVMRLTNYLSLTYPAVESEVNVIDFMIIETLRVFSPGVYDLVRRNQREFCVQQFRGTRGRALLPSSLDLSDAPPSPVNSELRKFHEDAFKTLMDRTLIKEEDKKPIQRLLVLMFPILASIFRADWPPDRLSQSRKRGIKDPDRFPYYFRLPPPAGGISQAETSSIMNDNDAFAQTTGGVFQTAGAWSMGRIHQIRVRAGGDFQKHS
jgi:predicted KAP-like P-loop ATPase